MTVHDETISKIKDLPEPLAQEVSDFVDFLLTRHNNDRWQLWSHFTETLEMGEADFSDYLSNLEEYEEQLARGAISW